MDDSTNPRSQATASLAEMFLERARRASDLASLEADVIDLGHKCMAEALAIALEALDAHLLSERPDHLRVHDVRPRSLATEIGDVDFSIRRYESEMLYASRCRACLLSRLLPAPSASALEGERRRRGFRPEGRASPRSQGGSRQAKMGRIPWLARTPKERRVWKSPAHCCRLRCGVCV